MFYLFHFDYVDADAHRGQKPALNVALQKPSILFYETGPPIGLELADQTRLVSSRAPGILGLHFSSSGITGVYILNAR